MLLNWSLKIIEKQFLLFNCSHIFLQTKKIDPSAKFNVKRELISILFVLGLTALFPLCESNFTPIDVSARFKFIL